jgi:hypothetical protein
LLLLAQIATAQPAVTVAQRVTEDAIAVDRVAQASKRDLPKDLLLRIIEEDIDLLRGKRPDGSYQYATFERFDSGRISSDFSVNPDKEEMRTIELKGAWVYRVLIEVPGRRLLVRRNRPVWVERVDLEYIAERSAQVERQTIEIKQWLQPGEFRPVDLPQIARQATVRVIATSDPKGGYANVVLSLIKARIVDNADSPYANAVTQAKAVQKALEGGDIAAIRTASQRLRSSLSGGAVATMSAPAGLRPAASQETEDSATRLEMQAELQVIEDLLTGSESERREGLDRLHQLIRRLRQ